MSGMRPARCRAAVRPCRRRRRRTATTLFKSRAYAPERELERLARNARHERLDHPAESERHIARERDRFALFVRALVARFEPAIRVQSPQVAAALLSGRAFTGGIDLEQV